MLWSMPLLVGCAQIAPQKGKVAENLDKIAAFIQRALEEGVDLLVFPEASASGYFVEGGVLETALSEEDLCSELQHRLTDVSRPIDIATGYYQSSGGNLYNAVSYLEVTPNAVRVLHTYQKFFLPTYGMFDEERFVSRGRDIAAFETRFGKVGLLICEDTWHTILPTLTAMAGAQIIIVPAASPGRGFAGETVANLDRYQRLMMAMAEEHGIYAINCQLCGFEGGKGFVGGSMVLDPYGKLVAQGPVNEEHLLVAPIDLDLVEVARAQGPLISDLQSAWGDIQRIVAEL